MKGSGPRTPTSEGGASSSPSSSGLRAGVELNGRWQLVAPLGAGGMGEVWRARHSTLGRDVAIKLLTSSSAASRVRILREAQVLASLRHEAVVEVFDLGEHQGTPYFVMGWIDGETLAESVARNGPLAAREAARAFIPLLEGLAAAHRLGVVHRDVKPDNVVSTRRADGSLRLVLIDFGIAQLQNAGSQLTATGALVGTPEYMAPEVLRGVDADERADVWGAAATLFEALTGTSPFRRGDFVATVRAVTEEEPSPSTALPAGISSILLRGLDKVPSARFQTARSMAEALEAWVGGSADPAERGSARTQPAPRASAPSSAPALLPPVAPAPAPTSFDALIRARFGKP